MKNILIIGLLLSGNWVVAQQKSLKIKTHKFKYTGVANTITLPDSVLKSFYLRVTDYRRGNVKVGLDKRLDDIDAWKFIPGYVFQPDSLANLLLSVNITAYCEGKPDFIIINNKYAYFQNSTEGYNYLIPYLLDYRLSIRSHSGTVLLDTLLSETGSYRFSMDIDQRAVSSKEDLPRYYADLSSRIGYPERLAKVVATNFTREHLRSTLDYFLIPGSQQLTLEFSELVRGERIKALQDSAMYYVRKTMERRKLLIKESQWSLENRQKLAYDAQKARLIYQQLLEDKTLEFADNPVLNKQVKSALLLNIYYLDFLSGKREGCRVLQRAVLYEAFGQRSPEIESLDSVYKELLFSLRKEQLMKLYKQMELAACYL